MISGRSILIVIATLAVCYATSPVEFFRTSKFFNAGCLELCTLGRPF